MNERIATDRELLVDVHRRVAALADVLLAGPVMPEKVRFWPHASNPYIFDLSPLIDRSDTGYVDLRLRVTPKGPRVCEVELVLDSFPFRRFIWSLDGDAIT